MRKIEHRWMYLLTPVMVLSIVLCLTGCAKTTSVKLVDIERDSGKTVVEQENTGEKTEETAPSTTENDVVSNLEDAPTEKEDSPEESITEPREPEKDAVIQDESAQQGRAQPEAQVETYETAVPETDAAQSESAKEEAEPDEQEVESRDYILNKNSKKIHYPSCSAVKKMADKNKQEYIGTVQELKEMGYSPCGICRPN